MGVSVRLTFNYTMKNKDAFKYLGKSPLRTETVAAVGGHTGQGGRSLLGSEDGCHSCCPL